MNIFIFDEDIKKNVSFYPDKYIVKMLLENVQILSSVYYFRNSVYDPEYKLAYKNHPCNIWARESFENFMYLRDLVKEIYNEFKFRYNKEHKSGIVFEKMKPYIPSGFPKDELTPFAQAMPDIYKDKDPVKAYRNYFIGEKKHIAKWSKREVPYWFC